MNRPNSVAYLLLSLTAKRLWKSDNRPIR